jgi:phage baseplate assembly protein W
MAYNLVKISPLDLKPSTAIGVKIPFSKPSAFQSVYTTKEQLKYNIINYLLTDKRERIFASNFGAGIRRRLFEQITQESVDSLQHSMKTDLENYFPNINIKRLDIVGTPDDNSINIVFSYSIVNTNENDTIVLNVQNA